ncbi:excalibur calcium-binding domain-containing protein [Deinococcus sp. JMULE3]|uniref:excalibur calcium-binding domain-containing protein n=1 Tax=Deinococcus sp. JMULE3 TaxID=2518341 RepID=UPI001576F0C5|nr:excalibur calcium-binding domain-containing protein [Deinococcus sp. JMULE3]NTX99863.1 excalibur calcium-binding domain-containing protein [Deinococcus sp. JMULE3]
MHRLIRPLLPLLLCGAAHATPAWVMPVTKLYPVPNQTSTPLRTLGARTALNLNRCYALWCDVQFGTQRGWVLRAAVDTTGDCRRLVPLGLKDLRRTEAAYHTSRDPNRNGVACEPMDRPLLGR